jgi:hypothetical protein
MGNNTSFMPPLEEYGNIDDRIFFLSYEQAFKLSNEYIDKISYSTTIKEWCNKNSINYNSLMTHVRNGDPNIKKSPKLIKSILEVMGKSEDFNVTLNNEPTYSIVKKDLSNYSNK